MIWLIAKREIVTRARSRGFQVIMGVFFLGTVAAGVLPTVLSGGDGDGREVFIGLGAEVADLQAPLEMGNDELDPVVEVVGDDVNVLLEDGDLDVAYDGRALTWAGIPDLTLDTYVRGVVQQVALSERAVDLGLGPDELGTLFAPVEIEEVRLDGGGNQFVARAIVAGVAAFGTFILLSTWGSFMTLGVIEEKSSRVVEILLSHVRPATLLGGKLIGLGALAALQMSTIVLASALTLLTWQDLDVPSGVWGAVPLMLVTFVFGFAFYATGFATVGSMVPRVEDAQSVQGVMSLPLVVGYVIAAASFTSPGSTVVTVASFVPFTAPVIIPFRMALVDPPLWQPILSLVILAASTLVMLRIAGAIYRYSLLRTGSRVGWREAWQGRRGAET